MEQFELLAQLAVVALLGLFELMQIGIQFFLLRPGRAIDALQHLVLGIAAPVCTRQFHQLEHLQLAGRRHVRAAAQVGEIALGIQRHFLVGGNGRDDLGLVMLVDALEIFDRLIARQYLARHRNVALGQFAHAFFQCGQVFRRERAMIGEIVKEAVLDHRADGHLRIGKQLLDSISQQVGGGVANDLQTIRILVGDDGQRCILRDQIGSIHQPSVHFPGQRGTRQAGTDTERNIGNCHWLCKAALRTIR